MMDVKTYKTAISLSPDIHPHPIKIIKDLIEYMPAGICLEDKRKMTLRNGRIKQKRQDDMWVVIHLPSFFKAWRIHTGNYDLDQKTFNNVVMSHPCHIGRTKWRIIKHQNSKHCSLFKFKDIGWY